VDGDERGADRRLHPIRRAVQAVRARLDRRVATERWHRRLILLLADADVEHLLALAAVAEDRDAETAELPRELVRARDVVFAGLVRQVDRLRHAVVGVALERRLMLDVPLEADLVRGLEDLLRSLRQAGDVVERAV